MRPTYRKTASAPGHDYWLGWFLSEPYGDLGRTGRGLADLFLLRSLVRRHAGLLNHRHAGDGRRGNVLVAGPPGADQPPASDPTPWHALTLRKRQNALTPVPAFTKSSLEIDVGRLDENRQSLWASSPLDLSHLYMLTAPRGQATTGLTVYNFSN